MLYHGRRTMGGLVPSHGTAGSRLRPGVEVQMSVSGRALRSPSIIKINLKKIIALKYINLLVAFFVGDRKTTHGQPADWAAGQLVGWACRDPFTGVSYCWLGSGHAGTPSLV
jgi:hypothetical protein